MSFKLYQSKETIWWDNVIIENVPDWENDQYFNFVPVETNGISFETYNQGLINVKDKSITYFKLEKENGDHTYWFVKKVNKVLKDGYQLAVELDVWYTYTRRILKHLKNKDDYALIDRTHFTTTGFYKSFDNSNQYIKWMTKKDPIIDDLEPSYELLTYDRKTLSTQPLKALGGGVSEGTISYGSSSNHLYQLGLYLVFVAKPENGNKQVYDFFPVMVPEGELVNHSSGNRFYQNIVDITTTLVAKVTRYGADGFLGLYKGPVIVPKNNTYEITDAIDGKRFLFFSFDTMEQMITKIPFNLEFSENTKMLDQMLKLQTDVYFGTTKRKIKHYFKNFDYNNKKGRDELNVRFANGFIAFWKEWTHLFSIEDMESFGNQLPSPSGDYNKTLTQAKQNYDMGLANLTTNFAIGATSSALTSFFSPGIASVGFGSSVGGLVSGIIGNELSYKKAIAGSSATFVNSYTQDIFYFEMYAFINRSYNLSVGTTITPFNFGIRYNFNSSFKNAIKLIYDRIGYPIYEMINMRQFYQDNIFTRRYYIKFDQDWINVNIRKWLRGSDYVDVDSDVLNLVVQQLGNGLLCWKTDNITNGDID